MHPSLVNRASAFGLAVISLLTVLSFPAFSQSTGGRILGRVADPTAAVLAGVKVTLVNDATGASRDTQTNASGDYNFVEVVPGTYRVELSVGGQTYSQQFKLVKDPRLSYNDAELEEQFQFMKRVSDRLEQTMTTVRRIRDMRKRAEDMIAQAKKDGKNTTDLDKALKALNDKLYPIEERLVQFRARAGEDLINYPTGIDSKLERLLDFTSMADAPPTEGEKELYGRLSEGVTDRVRLVDQVEKTEYATVVKLAGSR